MVLKSQQDTKTKNTKNIQLLQNQLEEQKKKYEEEVSHLKVEKAEFEKSLSDSREYFEAEITTLVEEKNTFQENYDQMKKHYEGEVSRFQSLAETREEELGQLKTEVLMIKETLVAQEPRHREAMDAATAKLLASDINNRRLEGQLMDCNSNIQRLEEQVSTLGKQMTEELVAVQRLAILVLTNSSE